MAGFYHYTKIMALLISAITVLLTAFAISAVAAYISVTGMVAIFAASPIACYILFSTLEVGKLVSAQWLHSNWRNPLLSIQHKIYMVSAVVVLMVITAFGIYGFLAKGHLEQEAPIEGIALQIAQKEQAIKMATDDNARLTLKIQQLDANISSFLKGDKADRANTVRKSQRGERLEIEKEIKANNEKIKVLNDEILPLKVNSSSVSAKLGPIKFVAELFGWEDTGAAVRMLILMVMFAFDPLAVVMLLSGFISLQQWRTWRANRNLPTNPEPIPVQEVVQPVAVPVVEPVVPVVEPEVGEYMEPAPETKSQELELELEPFPAQPVADLVDIKDVVIESPPIPLEEPPVKRGRKKGPSAKALAKAADAYREKEQSDADRLIKILEKRPDLLNDVIEVVREDTKPAVAVPVSEVTGDVGTNKAKPLQTNVSQEEIDNNLRSPNTWLAKTNSGRNK